MRPAGRRARFYKMSANLYELLEGGPSERSILAMSFFCYGTGGNARFKLHVAPVALEYSEKDDRFRLIAEGRKRRWIINVGRITEKRERFPNPHIGPADLTKKIIHID